MRPGWGTILGSSNFRDRATDFHWGKKIEMKKTYKLLIQLPGKEPRMYKNSENHVHLVNFATLPARVLPLHTLLGRKQPLHSDLCEEVFFLRSSPS